MSDRRTSLEKLSKHLRISKEDVLRLLAHSDLQQTANSKGYVGWNFDEIKTFCENLTPELRSQLQGYRVSFENAKEKEKELLVSSGAEFLVTLTQAALLLDVPETNLLRFLNKNNVESFNSESETLWLKEAVLNIQAKPNRFQVLELRKLRETRRRVHHMNNTQLARLFDVPVSLVTVLKKRLKLTGINPLTESIVMETLSRADFSSKRLQVLTAADSGRNGKFNSKGGDDGVSRFVSRQNLPSVLGVTSDEVSVALRLKLIPADRQGRFVRDEISCVDVTAMLVTVRRSQGKAVTKQETVDELFAEMTSKLDIQVNIPERTAGVLKEATLYMGPTNSGKTFNALNALFEAYETNPQGTYVYAGPLRMLAFEVYEKMVERYGEENVGFITGEEQVNADAPLIAATVEMAPASGTALVLDEAHWIFEPSRGSNWTELLMGGNYVSMHILAAADAHKVILSLIDDAESITERTFTRKTPISFKGGVSVRDVPARTAVVCFSRKAVFGIAELLRETTNLKVGVLYGALPLQVRKFQVDKFISGDYDIIVTTDVIGHGINLPVDNVVFAETNKFDGVERRDIHLWEAAQIAGRAGRYGLSEEGSVFYLEGLERSEQINVDLVSDAAEAAQGVRSTAMVADYAVLSPKFADLNVTEPEMIEPALDVWHSTASKVFPSHSLTPSDSKDVRERLRVFESTLGLTEEAEGKKKPSVSNVTDIYGRTLTFDEPSWRVSANLVWQVVDGPFDVKLETIKMLARWLHADKMTNAVERLFALEVDGVEALYQDMEELETASRLISELKMVNVMFPDETYVLDEELQYAETAISDEIIAILSGTAVTMDYDSEPEQGVSLI